MRFDRAMSLDETGLSRSSCTTHGYAILYVLTTELKFLLCDLTFGSSNCKLTHLSNSRFFVCRRWKTTWKAVHASLHHA